MKGLNKRLLATLTPARAPPNPLLPPYAHSIPKQNDPIQPPYAHTLDQPSSSRTAMRRDGLKAPVRYALASTRAGADVKGKGRGSLPEAYRQRANEMLAASTSRKELWDAWEQSIEALRASRNGSMQIPQMPFQELAQHLATASTVDAFRESGSLIVRDVIPDERALGSAREVLRAIEERDGRPVFWHKALLALRGDPSVLSANNQLLRALFEYQEDAFMSADTIQQGTSRFSPSTSLLPWLTSTSPISATLVLTPLRVRIPPTFAASTYATIAPLIRSKQSKISFYDSTAYLSPDNHRLIDSSELAETTLEETRMSHLEGVGREVTLSPGDVLYALPSIPVSAIADEKGVEGLILPVSPILATTGEGRAQVEEQKRAFESGVPPPSAELGDGAVELESAGIEEDLGGYGARKAMGY